MKIIFWRPYANFKIWSQIEFLGGILTQVLKIGQKKCPFFKNVFQNGPKKFAIFNRVL